MKAEYINHMGDDLTVVNAARVSFNKESEFEEREYYENEMDAWPSAGKYLSSGDTKLINYLAKHNHWTPFSHAMITMRETVPIFVARQRFKHMVGFTYNEVSRRYVSDAPEFFVPDSWRGKPTDGAKQGSSNEIFDFDTFNDKLAGIHGKCLGVYNEMLRQGIAPEQARMVLPQSMMTSYYVTGSLAAWARAYKLRVDAHSQKEIRDLAKRWGEIIEPLYPVSWNALV